MCQGLLIESQVRLASSMKRKTRLTRLEKDEEQIFEHAKSLKDIISFPDPSANYRFFVFPDKNNKRHSAKKKNFSID